MIQPPEIKFTRSGSVDLAYGIMGQGDLDLVLMLGWVSHLEVLWELPEARRFLERFAGMGRVVVFDKRGTGLSDRPPEPVGTEQLVPDVLAVMDAAGMRQAVLIGWVDAAALAITVAATHPDRVRALVLGEVVPAFTVDETNRWGPASEIVDTLASAIENGLWGQAAALPLLAPSSAGDERLHAWFRRLERMSATPSMAAGLLRRTLQTDVRPLLSKVSVPALVVHRRDATLMPAEGMRWLADNLASGRYAEVPGDEVPGYLGDVDALMDEIEDFLLGTRIGSTGDRRVVTILVSDVVGSTELTADQGDRRWQTLLESHRRELRRLLDRYGGKEVDTAGDGFLVAFSSPTSALRCALAMTVASRSAGLSIRVGIHAGEVAEGPEGITGMAVNIGARVASAAEADQVVVSRTVRDLLMGSSFGFESLGSRELKGVPGDWELFAASADN